MWTIPHIFITLDLKQIYDFMLLLIQRLTTIEWNQEQNTRDRKDGRVDRL